MEIKIFKAGVFQRSVSAHNEKDILDSIKVFKTFDNRAELISEMNIVFKHGTSVAAIANMPADMATVIESIQISLYEQRKL